MAYDITLTPDYLKKAARFLKKHPDMRQKYAKAMDMLKADPFHPGLRLHKLTGGLEGLYTVSLDLQYRITLELYIQDNQAIPLNVGGHDEVYR